MLNHLTGSKEIIEKIKEAIDSDYELSQFKEHFYKNIISDLVFSDILETEIKVVVNRICLCTNCRRGGKLLRLPGRLSPGKGRYRNRGKGIRKMAQYQNCRKTEKRKRNGEFTTF